MKLAEQVLALESLQFADARSVKIALNYWTSIRAHHQAKSERQNPRELSFPIALRLFDAFMERGDPRTIQEIVKTEEHPMGGLAFLIEHLLFSFRDTHQIAILEKDVSKLHHVDLLDALLRASSVLEAMKRLQADPHFSEIPEDFLHVNLMELNLWSKRSWFLNQFGDINSPSAQIELACGGQLTVDGCVGAMMSLAKDLIDNDDAPHSKIYSSLISTDRKSVV